MAVVLVEGFDSYNGITSNTTVIGIGSAWNVLSTTNLTLPTGRFGGQAVSINVFNPGGVTRSWNQGISSFTVGFALYVSSLPTVLSTDGDCFLTLKSGGTFMMGIQLTNTGALHVRRMSTSANASTSLGNTAGGVIAGGSWYYIELSVAISDTTGTVNLRVNGQNLISLTNQDTRNGTPTTIDNIQIGGNNGGRGGTHIVDDLYIIDSTTPLGEQRVETLYPNADTAQKQWTASTGSNNYGTIDETLLNATDYVSSNTVGNYDLYDFGNLSTTPTTINAVVVNALAQKDNVGTRAIAITAKSGSNTSDAANTYLAGGFNIAARIMDTDPNNAGAWTTNAVNALQAGVKVTI
jgi:hypothetical protein